MSRRYTTDWGELVGVK
ncbi:hypothetical protein [Methylicorpusculum sp.]